MEYKEKMAVIAGASKVLELLARNPNASESEIIQHITDNAEEIFNKIDEGSF
jgi:hypothetical protein